MQNYIISLKNELVRHRQFRDQSEPGQAVVEHHAGFYNRQPSQQALG